MAQDGILFVPFRSGRVRFFCLVNPGRVELVRLSLVKVSRSI